MTALLLTAAFNFPADGLQERIGFWKAVFTEYGEDHLIFHDRYHVHLIYDVLDLKAGGIERTDRTAQREMESDYRQRVGEAITAIASTPSADWSDFTRSLARRVEESGVRDDPAMLAERIHVQRGVREKFSDGLKRYSSLGATVERIL